MGPHPSRGREQRPGDVSVRVVSPLSVAVPICPVAVGTLDTRSAYWKRTSTVTLFSVALGMRYHSVPDRRSCCDSFTVDPVVASSLVMRRSLRSILQLFATVDDHSGSVSAPSVCTMPSDPVFGGTPPLPLPSTGLQQTSLSRALNHLANERICVVLAAS